jgi:hypothetical protein
MDYGLWIMDYGLWIMDYGAGSVDCGPMRGGEVRCGAVPSQLAPLSARTG